MAPHTETASAPVAPTCRAQVDGLVTVSLALIGLLERETALLIDMKTPGIKLSPIYLLDGTPEVNEVHFDNVRVPVANLIGAENKGWTYAKVLLTHERTNIAGVPVDARVAAIFRPICPLFPIPITTTRPRVASTIPTTCAKESPTRPFKPSTAAASMSKVSCASAIARWAIGSG